MAQRVAVIGAGWAGLAAAVAACRAGRAVTLFEAARTAGGRARALDMRADDCAPASAASLSAAHSGMRLDNGQHILIGAYTDTLALMRTVGVDVDRAFLRLPLSLRFADGGGLALPDGPAPWNVVAGVLMARGWSWRDKGSLLRTTLRWQRAGFDCADTLTVADLCSGLTPRPRAELIDPLCVSALNTPAARASGRVFLRVLRDALLGPRGGGDLLLPRVDMGSLLPDPALTWLHDHGAHVRLGHRVRKLKQACERANPRSVGIWQVDDEPFDAVVLACPPHEAARLVALGCGDLPTARGWIDAADGLSHEAIATVYAYTDGTLQSPILALREGTNAPAQFVLDRSALCSTPGIVAFVVSASRGDRQALEAAVLQQARDQLGLADIRAMHTIVEKRATFACTPALSRPSARVVPHLWACGDYIDGPYPSTLEGAVRSGQAVARAIGSMAGSHRA